MERITFLDLNDSGQTWLKLDGRAGDAFIVAAGEKDCGCFARDRQRGAIARLSRFQGAAVISNYPACSVSRSVLSSSDRILLPDR